MDNAGLPGKPPNTSEAPPVDDIPVALRDTPEADRRYQVKPIVLIASLVGLGAIALIATLLAIGNSTPKAVVNTSSQPSPSPTATAGQTSTDILLGHFSYKEAPESELQSITADGRFKLRKPAAKQYKAMVAAARQSGVILVAISGFRPVSEQQHLFFDVKAQRGQDARERAEVSAPPGYSEHHTGYAVDIGDGNVPATNLNPKFENTAAFKWLKNNAARYSFEMSFPRDNPQGVSYEPWHWRFVGDTQSLETFYKAKNLKAIIQEPGAVQKPQEEPAQQPEVAK